jgi:hypothetical protein
VQVFEGTSGIDNKHTTIEFTGEVIQTLPLSEFLSFFITYKCFSPCNVTLGFDNCYQDCSFNPLDLSHSSFPYFVDVRANFLYRLCLMKLSSYAGTLEPVL